MNRKKIEQIIKNVEWGIGLIQDPKPVPLFAALTQLQAFIAPPEGFEECEANDATHAICNGVMVEKNGIYFEENGFLFTPLTMKHLQSTFLKKKIVEPVVFTDDYKRAFVASFHNVDTDMVIVPVTIDPSKPFTVTFTQGGEKS